MFSIHTLSLLLILTSVISAGFIPPEYLNNNYTTQTTTRQSTLYPITTTKAPQKACSYNGYWLDCNNFETFDQLNFKNGTYREQELIKIRPLNKIDLDDLFDLTGFSMKYSSLELANMKSFPFFPHPDRNIKGKSLYFRESTIDFVLNGRSIDETVCNELRFSMDKLRFFTSFSQSIGFHKTNEVRTLCPYIFYNMTLTNLFTHWPLKFYKTTEEDMKLSLQVFDLYNNTYSLDLDTVSPLVFNQIRSLRGYEVQLEHIDEYFFLHFPNLKYVRLVLTNMKEFFTRTSQNWMKHLNSQINVDLNNKTQTIALREERFTITFVDAKNEYQYPDEDFCHFAQFPHNHMAFFQIDSNVQLPCTCTIYWLYKHKEVLSFDLALGPMKKCFDNNQLSSKIEECDFESRLRLCEPTTTTTITTTTTTTASNNKKTKTKNQNSAHNQTSKP